jgi:putative NADPH-quinone reductase
MIFPLWHGTMPALLKAFIEQVMRPGVALRYRERGFPQGLLTGRSARLVVTVGMPATILTMVSSRCCLVARIDPLGQVAELEVDALPES